MSSIDLVPTLLSFAGARTPADLPGLDLSEPLKQGTSILRDALYGEGFAHDVADIDHPQASLLYRWTIQGDWKLLLTYDGEVNRYRSTHPRAEKRPQLFNLITDPHEKDNVASRHPERVARMAADIAGWWPVTERQVITEFRDE